jgi:hypothetical protein
MPRPWRCVLSSGVTVILILENLLKVEGNVEMSVWTLRLISYFNMGSRSRSMSMKQVSHSIKETECRSMDRYEIRN